MSYTYAHTHTTCYLWYDSVRSRVHLIGFEYTVVGASKCFRVPLARGSQHSVLGHSVYTDVGGMWAAGIQSGQG